MESDVNVPYQLSLYQYSEFLAKGAEKTYLKFYHGLDHYWTKLDARKDLTDAFINLI